MLETVPFGVLEQIEKLLPDLVVVGSHGKSGITRALLGSVSDAVCHRSPVPVLVVPTPKRKVAADRAAWSCRACGHILGDSEPRARCARCGISPVPWLSAEVSDEPIDLGEPSVGESHAETLGYERTNSPTGLFATSPPGASGSVNVNPELRVRY